VSRYPSRKSAAAKKLGHSVRSDAVNGSKAKPAKATSAVVKAKASGSRPVPVSPAKPVTAKPNGSPARNVILKGDAMKMRAKAHEPRKADLTPVRPPMPIPEAVPTNGKPRKNQAGLSPKELEHYRDLLLEKRRELVGDMYSMESEALRTSGGTNLSNLPLHMADMGTDNYEQEFTLGLVEKDRGLLREINTALAKIQNGTFGICEGTGKPIGKPRLEAQPWARHSIEYARLMQRPMGMGRVG
jgi:DnaK suppressor protein